MYYICPDTTYIYIYIYIHIIYFIIIYAQIYAIYIYISFKNIRYISTYKIYIYTDLPVDASVRLFYTWIGMEIASGRIYIYI